MIIISFALSASNDSLITFNMYYVVFDLVFFKSVKFLNPYLYIHIKNNSGRSAYHSPDWRISREAAGCQRSGRKVHAGGSLLAKSVARSAETRLKL